jgi:hypothetical protein
MLVKLFRRGRKPAPPGRDRAEGEGEVKRPANAKVRNDTDDPNALELLSWTRTMVTRFDFSGGSKGLFWTDGDPRPQSARWRHNP